MHRLYVRACLVWMSLDVQSPAYVQAQPSNTTKVLQKAVVYTARHLITQIVRQVVATARNHLGVTLMVGQEITVEMHDVGTTYLIVQALTLPLTLHVDHVSCLAAVAVAILHDVNITSRAALVAAVAIHQQVALMANVALPMV